jgi:hypothetical protein
MLFSKESICYFLEVTVKGFLAILIFLGGIALGFLYSISSWDGEKFISLSNLSSNPKRDLAAVKKVYDFTQHNMGGLLSSLSSYKVLTNAQISNEEGKYTLNLGHYALKTESGEHFLACQLYDKVIIEYLAEGQAHGDQIPKMEVVADCNILGNDINHIAPIQIPVKEILSAQPGDGVINYNENYHISVRFYNVADQWPKQWALQKVTLTDSHKEQFDTSINVKQALKTANLNMDWTHL